VATASGGHWLCRESRRQDCIDRAELAVARADFIVILEDKAMGMPIDAPRFN